MAEKKSSDNLVEVKVPRGPQNDDPNVFVSVNGVNYLLPRGKTSKVPPEVAQEYFRAQEAQETMERHIEEMLAASN